MKICVIGGSGFVGSALVSELTKAGHDVICLTRNLDNKTIPKQGQVRWKKLDWTDKELLDGAEIVINLAGETLFQLWTEKAKKRLIASRVETTQRLVNHMKTLDKQPRVLINASAVGYYGHVPTGECIESTPAGNGFLPTLCKAWEAEAREAEKQGVRVVSLRIGPVLDESRGLWPWLLRAFKWGVGGRLGSGDQWFSWVHRKDVVNVILFACQHEACRGPINVTSPNPITNKALANQISQHLNRPNWCHIPGWMIKRLLFGLEELFLEGANVVPKKLIDLGYTFRVLHIDNLLDKDRHQK